MISMSGAWSQSRITTSNFAKQEIKTTGNNLFVGGNGEVAVVNKGNCFTCAGGTSTMTLASNGDNCNIQLGSGAKGNTTDIYNREIKDSGFANMAVIVGSGNQIYGSEKADSIFSYSSPTYNAAPTQIFLRGGDDVGCIAGYGVKVNGDAGNDLITGAELPGLNYARLRNMDPLMMLATINAAAVRYKSV